MAKTDFKSIDEYIATFPREIQKFLEQYRQVIHEAVPEAKETISYQIPCFNLNGSVMYLFATKDHMSVSSPPPAMEHFKEELTAYKTSKSVFQVPYDQPIPKALITKIAKWRVAENTKKTQAH